MSKNASLSILITRFPYESVLSGEEWHTITLAEKLRSKGHTVAFMGSCSVFLKELPDRSFATYTQAGGFAPVSSKNLLLFLLTSPYFFLRWSLALIQLKKELSLTSVYMHSLSEKILLTPTALLLGLKVVWVEHQRWGRWILGNPLRYIYKLLSQFVDIIAVGPAYKEGFSTLGISSKKIHIITNGIDLNVFHTSVSPLPLGNEGIHIGTIARLSVDKGVDILIEAFARLVFEIQHATEACLPLHLHIIGEGPLKSQLEQRIHTLGCKDSIHMYVPYRTISRQDTPRFLKALDVFVLASALPDPFGLVVAESLAVGSATVVTEKCGIHYQLHNQTDALIIPGADEDALYNALKALVTNPDLRHTLEKNSRSTAEKEFSLDAMVDRYENVLTPSLLAAKQR